MEKKELEEYKKEYKDSNHLFDMYDGKSSPIRDALIVDMENANQIDAACKENIHKEECNFSGLWRRSYR